MARMMSDTELRRRKKLQGRISETTSTLGLAGLGMTGAAALASRKPGALRVARKIPKLHNVTPEKMKDTAITTGLVSGGIGGVGGYNFAAYTNAESRKRKTMVKPVAKNHQPPIEMGYYGDEGRQVKLPKIKVPIEKAWSPVATPFDSEARRQKRSKRYQEASLVGAGASSGYAGYHGTQAVKAGRKARPGLKNRIPGIDVHAPIARHGGRAMAGLAATGAALGAGEAIRRKREGSWQPYSKRNTVSAFGVDHSDEVSKAINIKPENKGKFTALARKRGEGVQQAAQELAHSPKATELQRKRAQFAINAKKWNHSGVSKARKVPEKRWNQIKSDYRLRTGARAGRWSKAGKLVQAAR